jgi:glycosyltransferase involved in cell wall biosynthesis
MRVGLVTGEFPPMEGGVGAFTEQLARALSALGHEIHVISSRNARPASTSRTPAAVREPVDLGYARLHPRIGRWRWPSLSTVADVAIRHDLDVLNLQYQAAAFNMRSPAINYLPWRMKGILPTVVTFHDLRVPYLFPKAGPLRETAVRGLARRAQGCIATNAADYRILRSWTDNPLVEIPIGSNIAAYRPNHIEIAEARDKLGLDGDAILLGYFGFLNETKGADTLIDALARLDDRHHLIFIGGQTGASDPDNNQAFLVGLRRQIESLGVQNRVHWTGFLAPERVSTYLTAADMMIMPYRDGVSLRRGTLMAVLAHGRPLITTAPAESTPEFRHGENMWLVAPGDVEGVVNAVTSLAGDEGARARLGQGALELTRSFSWDGIAARTAAFYADVLTASSR